MLIAEAAPEREVGFRGGAVIVALGLMDMRGDIAAKIGVDAGRVLLQGLFDVDHCGKTLKIDRNVVQRILGNVAALGHDNRERLAGTADDVFRQRNVAAQVENDARHRWRRHKQRSGLPIGAKILGRVHGNDAIALQSRRSVDPVDTGMRDLAAQEGGVQHARQLDIVDE